MEQNYNYIPQPGKQFRFSVVQVSIWFAVLLMGIVLKLQHWPGNAISIITGSAGLTGYNFVALLLLRGKHALNNVLVAAAGVWLIVLLWGMTMNDGHPYNEEGAMVYAVIFILVAGINALAYGKYFRRSN
jgi:hypothetical protein